MSVAMEVGWCGHNTHSCGWSSCAVAQFLGWRYKWRHGRVLLLAHSGIIHKLDCWAGEEVSMVLWRQIWFGWLWWVKLKAFPFCMCSRSTYREGFTFMFQWTRKSYQIFYISLRESSYQRTLFEAIRVWIHNWGNVLPLTCKVSKSKTDTLWPTDAGLEDNVCCMVIHSWPIVHLPWWMVTIHLKTSCHPLDTGSMPGQYWPLPLLEKGKWMCHLLCSPSTLPLYTSQCQESHSHSISAEHPYYILCWASNHTPF